MSNFSAFYKKDSIHDVRLTPRLIYLDLDNPEDHDPVLAKEFRRVLTPETAARQSHSAQPSSQYDCAPAGAPCDVRPR